MLEDDVIEQLAPQSEILARIPRPLEEDEGARVGSLIRDAVEAIAVEFDDAGRDLLADLAADATSPVQPLHYKVRWAVREMVSAAVLIGENTGMRSVTSSTGAQSDAVTFSDVDAASWSGISVTDRIRQRLGLPTGVRPRGRFPRPPRWPEVMLDGRRGCEWP
ncbi:hypothetical protein G6031_09620 [Dietzia sp. CQ4]|uniref:Gp19/Gp15/Gp42 family protein n=1 Tax=Dietzia sp. (strain CQ4) TaxID=370437 RepID=UPI0015F86914|nr:Gp19/Gp15/Gp42 family protein [Dietzia sp. CQ4]MBB1034646.1 hypothetical protein [Dietzia sp. CQ4]